MASSALISNETDSKSSHNETILPVDTDQLIPKSQDLLTGKDGIKILPKGMTFNGAIITMIKLMLGAGVLALPNAFSKAGFWASLIIYPILGVLCWYTMMLLLDSKNEAIRKIELSKYLPPKNKDPKIINGTYNYGTMKEETPPVISETEGKTNETVKNTELMENDCSTEKENDENFGSQMVSPVDYEKSKQKMLESVRTYRGVGEYAFGAVGRWMVLIAVVALQLSFCIGYVLVVSNTSEEYFAPKFPRWAAPIVIFPVLAIFALIRWIKDLTFISIFGTVVYLAGVMGVTIVYAIPILARGAPDPTKSIIFSTLPLFLGTALYSLEGINGVLPIESDMKERSRAPSAMLVANMLYAAGVSGFASVAYMAGFGKVDVVVEGLPHGVIKAIVQWSLVLALLATHPIQLFPATELLEEQFFPHSSTFLKRAILRVFLVAFTCLIGAIVHELAAFTNLVGSLFLSFSGFVVPPLLFLKIVWTRQGISQAILAAIVGCFGVIFMVYGTTMAVIDLVASF
jgi:proton-coupled amino acid transporter